MKREGFTDTEKYKMLLSRETLHGLRFTGMNLSKFAQEFILSFQ